MTNTVWCLHGSWSRHRALLENMWGNISKAWTLVDRNSEMFIFILTNIPSIYKNLTLAKSGWRAYGDSLCYLWNFCNSKIIIQNTKLEQKQQYKGTYNVLLFQARPSLRYLLRDCLKVLGGCSLGGFWFGFSGFTQCSQTWRSIKYIFISFTLIIIVLVVESYAGWFLTTTLRNCATESSLGIKVCSLSVNMIQTLF